MQLKIKTKKKNRKHACNSPSTSACNSPWNIACSSAWTVCADRAAAKIHALLHAISIKKRFKSARPPTNGHILINYPHCRYQVQRARAKRRKKADICINKQQTTTNLFLKWVSWFSWFSPLWSRLHSVLYLLWVDPGGREMVRRGLGVWKRWRWRMDSDSGGGARCV